MKRINFSRLRFRLLLLVILASIPAMLLTINNAIEERNAATSRIRAETLQLTNLTVINQEQWIESSRQLLVSMAYFPAVRNRDPAACNQFFADIHKHYPLYSNLFAVMPDGDLFCSAVPIKQPVNFADLAWFKRAVTSGNFSIGDYQASGVIANLPVIVTAYPIYDDEGNLQAVVSTSLDLAWLNEEAAKIQLSPGSTFRLIDQKGTILARNPDPEKWVGQSQPQAEIISKTLDRHEGTTEARGVDGVIRFFAFAPVHSGTVETGLFVSNGIPVSFVLTQINAILVRNLKALGIAILFMLIIAWFVSDAFVLRNVNTILKATERLGTGDLSVRTGLTYDAGEMGELARVFDKMVESLQDREEQRKQAVDALKKNEEKFRTVADFAYEWEYWVDHNQQLVYISHSAQRISGYRPEEFIADPGLLYSIVHPDDKALYQQHISGHFEGGALHNQDEVEFRIIARNGEVHWINHVCCAIYNIQGQYMGRRASNRDITGRIQAEEELKKYREQLEELVRQRTAELKNKNEELEKFNKLFVGRELRMIELKKHIEELKKQTGSLENKTGT